MLAPAKSTNTKQIQSYKEVMLIINSELKYNINIDINSVVYHNS